MSQMPDESREIRPFSKLTPPMSGSYDQMPPTESRPIYPFLMDKKPDYVTPETGIIEPTEEADVPDPKDESAVASVASLESQHQTAPIALGTTVPTPARTETLQAKDNVNSSPSSSSATSPGWNTPPAPAVPPATRE